MDDLDAPWFFHHFPQEIFKHVLLKGFNEDIQETHWPDTFAIAPDGSIIVKMVRKLKIEIRES